MEEKPDVLEDLVKQINEKFVRINKRQHNLFIFFFAYNAIILFLLMVLATWTATHLDAH